MGAKLAPGKEGCSTGMGLPDGPAFPAPPMLIADMEPVIELRPREERSGDCHMTTRANVDTNDYDVHANNNTEEVNEYA